MHRMYTWLLFILQTNFYLSIMALKIPLCFAAYHFNSYIMSHFISLLAFPIINWHLVHAHFNITTLF